MSQRQIDRFLMFLGIALLIVLLLAAQTEKAKAATIWEREMAEAGWCNGNDDQVKDIDGRCHQIEKWIDAYRDTITLAPDCQEDEDWIAVHYLDPRGREDQHGVSRACVNREEE